MGDHKGKGNEGLVNKQPIPLHSVNHINVHYIRVKRVHGIQKADMN